MDAGGGHVLDQFTDAVLQGIQPPPADSVLFQDTIPIDSGHVPVPLPGAAPAPPAAPSAPSPVHAPAPSPPFVDADAGAAPEPRKVRSLADVSRKIEGIRHQQIKDNITRKLAKASNALPYAVGVLIVTAAMLFIMQPSFIYAGEDNFVNGQPSVLIVTGVSLAAGAAVVLYSAFA